MPHEFARDSDGDIILNEFADTHNLPYCTRCGQWLECYLCFPETLTEDCDEQTSYLY